MSADVALRLAWQSHREGRIGRRDALLTLAVAEGSEIWTEPIRTFLVASRPDHFFAGFPTRDLALKDRRVQEALKRLRMSFPATRIRSLVQRSEVARGPFMRRRAGIRVMLDDLFGSRPHSRALLAVPVPARKAPVLVEPTSGIRDVTIPDATTEPFLAFYLQTLIAIAVLCATVLQESGQESRAA